MGSAPAGQQGFVPRAVEGMCTGVSSRWCLGTGLWHHNERSAILPLACHNDTCTHQTLPDILKNENCLCSAHRRSVKASQGLLPWTR